MTSRQILSSWLVAMVLATAPVVARAGSDSSDWSGGASTAKDSKNSKDSKDKNKSGTAAKPDEPKSDEKPFDTVVKDMEKVDGLFTFYRRPEEGKVYLEIQPDQLDKLFLFASSIDHSTGERGFYASMMGTDFAFMFHRAGKSIQWIQKNPSFEAAASTPQAKAIERSFPDAILGSVKILSKPHSDRKSLLIDASDLFVARDLPGLAPALSNAYSPTNYNFDKEKSSITNVKTFPQNVLVDVTMHYQTDNAKTPTITLADPRSVPIGLKYMLSSIPASTYKPRLADDRVGHFLTTLQDFSSDHPSTPYVRYINRWNLEKQDPSAALSPPKQPIVFWLENTIPLEYRDAIREGALVWNKAFEKVGFKDAVVVKQMPDSADWDPADVRYNVIRWFAGVDATFAIGPSRANPFTGEIYDADIGISEGIVRGARRLSEEFGGAITTQPGEQQKPVAAPFAWAKDMRGQCDYASGLAEQASLGMGILEARGELSPEVEQKLMHEYVFELTAHEVGHTLGLRHNFHGSSILPVDELGDVSKTDQVGQSASVMDYNPVIIAADGAKQGHFVTPTIGPYDYWAIEYAYTPIQGDEKEPLAKIASRCADPALAYSTDEDASGTYSPLSIDPYANQYDMSSDPLEYFEQRVQLVNEMWKNMETRLAHEGEGYQIMRRALNRGLNDDFRSLVTSSKFVGGVYHERDHVGDPNGRPPYAPVPAAKQRAALQFLSRHAFSESAFQVPPSLMNKLAVERIPGLDYSYWNTVRLDYPWHDNVLRIQKAVLDRLYHPVTLSRILDNELRFKAGEPVFHMSDLFSTLTASIWSELDGPDAEISSMRRNLQREHLKQLIHLTLRDTPATMIAGGPTTVQAPEDATTLARASLVKLQTKIRAKLAGKTVLEPTTKAHLQETSARITAALDAQLQRNL